MKKNKCLAFKQILLLFAIMVITSLGVHEIIKAAPNGETTPAVTASIAATASVSTSNQIVNVEVTGITATGGTISQLDLHFVNASGLDVYSIAATKTSDTAYSAVVDAAVLNPQHGIYNVFAVANMILADGVTSAAVNVENKATVELAAAYSAGISAGGNDKAAGTFVVTAGPVYGAGAIADVSVVVASVKNPEISYTYKGLKADASGNYKAKVEVSDLSYKFGDYTISNVVTLADGTVTTVATSSYSFAPKNFIRFGDTDRKKLTKKIYIYNVKGLKNLTANVWSKKSDKADIKTYKFKKKDGHLEFTIDMNELKYPGTIYVEISQNNGTKEYKTVSFEAKKKDIVKNGWYYEKASNNKTYKYYYKSGKKVTNLTKVLDLKKETKDLHIVVNRKKNRVTVYAYDEDTDSYCIPVISFICSVGVNTPDTFTPTGTYKSDRKHRWKALMEESWGQYATHIVRGVYFHSVAGGATNSYAISAYSYNKLGMAASHGCIRLTVRDAKWIFDYCAIGTEIKIGDWDFEGPLKPQKVTKIPAGQHYDPTDPAVKKDKK